MREVENFDEKRVCDISDDKSNEITAILFLLDYTNNFFYAVRIKIFFILLTLF